MLAAMVITAFCLICWLTAAKPPKCFTRRYFMAETPDVQQSIAQQIREDSALGPNRDQRGCLQAAGFVWCEGIGKCIRPWKESCPGGTEFCRNYCLTSKKQNPNKLRTVHSIRCGCHGLEDLKMMTSTTRGVS
ncbi:unnamed protein product [Durusdinium trenchii]|uniref:Secreted protein n=1 Tax=Durusdinium trenchii TaxID=1381693 RepID=A0ABP0JEZ0_9DINO